LWEFAKQFDSDNIRSDFTKWLLLSHLWIEEKMKTIPDSGFLYPNSFVHHLLLSLEDVLGKNGVKAVLNIAGQSSMIDNYPPDDMTPGVDIARYSSIIGSLDDLYGERGAQVLALKAGNVLFLETMKKVGDPLKVNSDGFIAKTIEEKVESALIMIQNYVAKTSISSIPRTADGQFLYITDKCPICYGRQTKTPRCYLTAGLLQAAIRYATGGLDFAVTQTKGHSCGDPTCDYVIPVLPNA
jgi:hypothetical protein